jgi:hypothetical protein
MRYFILPAVASLLFTIPGALAEGVNQPIPQDPAREEQRYRERLDWNQRTLGGAYQKVGHKDPRWDNLAEQALDAAARAFSLQVEPVITRDELFQRLKRAVNAGCDDPLILYLYARLSIGRNDVGPNEELEKRQITAATAMQQSRYPPFRRALALSKTGLLILEGKNLSSEARTQAGLLLDAAPGPSL